MMTDNEREYTEWLENENERLEQEIKKLETIIVNMRLLNHFEKDNLK